MARKTIVVSDFSGYEEHFEADGLLTSIYAAAENADEQKRQRSARAGRKQPRAIPGDATAFVSHTIPNGTLMKPGEVFTETWTIHDAGSVPWKNRRLERQGPLTGPGLITSQRYTDIPDTDPGEEAIITAVLKAQGYDATAIAYFKMVDESGLLCFPDEHQLGPDVVVRVERNRSGAQ